MSETREAAERQEGKLPAFRYSAQLAGEIEARWQRYWGETGAFHAPNPVGPLSEGFDALRDLPHLYVMDMFPYPSGSGLHVGHPLGYIGTDVYARFQRMAGFNVLHAMGYDAFGLPAEQYAVQTGQHPRVTTEANIANMRRQLARLGLGHDERRSLATSDRSYYRWTQWIFLQIYNAWYDEDQQRARPIAELVEEFAQGRRQPAAADGTPTRPWQELSPAERDAVVDRRRLVYLDDVPVNWCPGLGTVLANEEVTADGRSERGNFPVYRRPLRQWLMRITAYADRLIDDLDGLDWPDAIKLQQRNWIGRSRGARIWFPTEAGEARIEVFTTRPDTLFGATFMVLAPEHPLVDTLTPPAWPEGTKDAWTQGAATPGEAVAGYRGTASRKSDLERRADVRDKTGVFTGAYARNPASGGRIPVFIADYVLMGYGTGAIMAVPDGDSRDFAFAKAHDLDIVKVKQPPAEWLAANGVGPDTPAEQWPDAYEGDGIAVNSHNDEVSLDGLPSEEAKVVIVAWLEEVGLGEEAVTFRLRDWLFSRQRYWGEPFPIVYDEQGRPHPLPESLLPVDLPEITDYAPRVSDDEHAEPETPLSRAEDWVTVELDLGDGPKTYRRDTNTMPQWAGSCWYHLRYLDPADEQTFSDPEIQRYWLGDGSKHLGGVDLYVGGVEHAVLHLLYARFWHKVLYDLGHVFQEEPFQRLYNQGYILAAAYTDERGFHVEAAEVVETPEGFRHHGQPVTRDYGKMGKSLKNAVSPDDMYTAYGADTLRLYEMFTGPLDQARPWETRAVVGVFRFLQRVWRLAVDEDSGALRVSEDPLDDASRRVLHGTVAAVRQGMEGMRFNTAIARLMELTTQLTTAYQDRPSPREGLEPLVLMLAPLAPHLAEELWQRLGHDGSLVHAAFPVADASLLVEERMRFPVQVKGKVRATAEVAAGADDEAMEQAARSHPAVARLLDGREVRRVVVVPGRLVNFVTD